MSWGGCQGLLSLLLEKVWAPQPCGMTTARGPTEDRSRTLTLKVTFPEPHRTSAWLCQKEGASGRAEPGGRLFNAAFLFFVGQLCPKGHMPRVTGQMLGLGAGDQAGARGCREGTAAAPRESYTDMRNACTLRQDPRGDPVQEETLGPAAPDLALGPPPLTQATRAPHHCL